MDLNKQNQKRKGPISWQAIVHKNEPVREPVIHYVTQEGQPYGSLRKACNMCGAWVHENPEFNAWWTEDREVYNNPKEGLRRCRLDS